MLSRYAEIFRRHARPIEPIATACAARWVPLEDLRAVLFDVYGTLLVSGSGEVGTQAGPSSRAMAEALWEFGLRLRCDPDEAVALFFETIHAGHARRRQAEGIDFPELQVAEIWRETLAELARRGWLEPEPPASLDVERLAVEYEARANPCWPMPGVEACLARLGAKGLRLGIVSNAQFYTPELFPALLGREAEALGFDPALVFYSYRHGAAKPGTILFAAAAEALAARGVAPGQTLYVGNDLLNDICPAARLGFRTALYAGDARSLRLREGEPLCRGVEPDVVLTALDQLDRCVMIA